MSTGATATRRRRHSRFATGRSQSSGSSGLIALIYPENIRSIRVAEKLGMEPEDEIEIFGNRVTRYSLGNLPAR